MPRTKSSAPQVNPKERKPSAAELAARARGMKGSPKLAEQFAISDDYVRETVVVKELPTPPSTETMETVAHSRTPAQAVNVEAAVLQIFQEEAEEIGVRLERFGVAFTPAMKQDVVDHCFALLSMHGQGLLVGGGALARR